VYVHSVEDGQENVTSAASQRANHDVAGSGLCGNLEKLCSCAHDFLGEEWKDLV
jgi:hypothetical protein